MTSTLTPSSLTFNDGEFRWSMDGSLSCNHATSDQTGRYLRGGPGSSRVLLLCEETRTT